jgi:hypothetical protein
VHALARASNPSRLPVTNPPAGAGVSADGVLFVSSDGMSSDGAMAGCPMVWRPMAWCLMAAPAWLLGAGKQRSSRLLSMRAANALVVVPKSVGQVGGIGGSGAFLAHARRRTLTTEAAGQVAAGAWLPALMLGPIAHAVRPPPARALLCVRAIAARALALVLGAVVFVSSSADLRERCGG